MTSGFGIRVFYDKPYIFTSFGKLVYFSNQENDDKFSNLNIYYYVKEDDSDCVSFYCKLSDIPIYKGNTPNCSMWKDDFKRQELIDASKICIYFYKESENIRRRGEFRFFTRFVYNDEVYNKEFRESELYLLKYYWLMNDNNEFFDFKKVYDGICNAVNKSDVVSLFSNDFKIVSGDYVSYNPIRSDWGKTVYSIERWLIETDDLYVIYKLSEISNKKKEKDVIYLYGKSNCEYFNSLNYGIKDLLCRNFLIQLEEIHSVNFNLKKSMKYFFLLEELRGNYRHAYSSYAINEPLEHERREYDKEQKVKEQFFSTYNKTMHICELIHFFHEALIIPKDMLNEVIYGYKKWHFEEVTNSGLKHLIIYWPYEKICNEFNKWSNEKFKFGIDFSIFEKDTDSLEQ